jgi:hypothetical protein
LYPGLSDTVDHFDAKYFELLPNMKGFEHAVFYIRNNQRLVSKVTFSEYGETRDTNFIQPLSALNDTRKKIEEIELENEKKYESPREFIIETKSGDVYLGEIEMFNKFKIYFRTEETVSTNSFNDSKFKIDYLNIETLTLVGETNTWSCMGYGALVGLGASLVGAIAFSSGEDSGIAYLIGASLTVIGGISGLIFGLASSTGDELLLMDYQEDLQQLKNYAKYYFKYDNSLEEKYVEIE